MYSEVHLATPPGSNQNEAKPILVANANVAATKQQRTTQCLRLLGRKCSLFWRPPSWPNPLTLESALCLERRLACTYMYTHTQTDKSQYSLHCSPTLEIQKKQLLQTQSPKKWFTCPTGAWHVVRTLLQFPGKIGTSPTEEKIGAFDSQDWEDIYEITYPSLSHRFEFNSDLRFPPSFEEATRQSGAKAILLATSLRESRTLTFDLSPSPLRPPQTDKRISQVRAERGLLRRRWTSICIQGRLKQFCWFFSIPGMTCIANQRKLYDSLSEIMIDSIWALFVCLDTYKFSTYTHTYPPLTWARVIFQMSASFFF